MPHRKNPVESCVTCLAGVGFGLTRIERTARVNKNVARKWLIRAGLYRPQENLKRKQALANAVHRRKRDAKFPLALCAFSVPCRVERVEPLRKTTAERNALALAYYHANRERVRARANVRLRERNKDAGFRRNRIEQHKRWVRANPHKSREYYKKAKAASPERFRAYQRKERAKPYNRIVSNLRGRLREIVKRNGGSISSRLTGCSADTLKLHLQSQFKRGMAWNNYGTVWVVDHIVPCAKFDLSIESQQQACFHFSNLRPLFAQENADKSDNVEPCQPELVLML